MTGAGRAIRHLWDLAIIGQACLVDFAVQPRDL